MYWNNLKLSTFALPVAAIHLWLTLAMGAIAGPGASDRQPVVVFGPGQCRTCHARLEDTRLSSPTVTLPFDMHAKEGLGCADCHGGDPKATDEEKAHSKESGFMGRFDIRSIPDLCGRCHSNADFMKKYNPRIAVDQLEKYKTSRHGELLDMGLRKVAQCASCHTAHNVRPASDPQSSVYPVNVPRTCAHCHGNPEYMAGFPIPTDQFEKYAVSVHGIALLEKEDLSAPACNDCHGNHGAVPPGAQSLAHVCGTCHALNMEMFEKSPHAKVFELQELPQCTVCHNHHAIAAPSIRTFNMVADSVCITCHRRNDAGWKAGQTIYAITSNLYKLRDRAQAVLDQAQSLGMDVSDGRFLMRDLRNSMLQLRTLTHRLDLAAYTDKSKEAKKQVEDAIVVAESAIDEFHFRRKGLLVAFILAMPLLVLLYLKVRTLDVKPGAGVGHGNGAGGNTTTG